MSWDFFLDGTFKEIRDFMKSAQEVDEREDQERDKKDKEYDSEIRKKWAAEFEQAAKAEDEYREVEGHTLEEIRRGLKLKYEKTAIKQALEANAEQMAHRPHPDGTRYALREHLTRGHYDGEWIPGVD